MFVVSALTNLGYNASREQTNDEPVLECGGRRHFVSLALSLNRPPRLTIRFRCSYQFYDEISDEVKKRRLAVALPIRTVVMKRIYPFGPTESWR